MTSIRDAFGKALVDAGAKYPELVAVSCDLKGATRLKYFTDAFPERSFEVGIAEANGIGIAAGLALEGFRPVIASFGAFITGKNVEIRTSIAYNKAPVVIVGTHGGLIGPDGATQAGLQDISVMRSIPNFNIYQPATPNETKIIVDYAAKTNELIYLRIARNEVPEYFNQPYFKPGKGCVMLDLSHKNRTIITSGPMLHNCMEASKDLPGTQVVNMPSIKPIDEELITFLAKETQKLFVVEDHSTKGGLGSAVAEVVSQLDKPCPTYLIGINTFILSGKPNKLETIYGLDPKSIKERIECQ